MSNLKTSCIDVLFKVLGLLPVNERRDTVRAVNGIGVANWPLWRGRAGELGAAVAAFVRHKRQSGPYLSQKSIPLPLLYATRLPSPFKYRHLSLGDVDAPTY